MAQHQLEFTSFFEYRGYTVKLNAAGEVIERYDASAIHENCPLSFWSFFDLNRQIAMLVAVKSPFRLVITQQTHFGAWLCSSQKHCFSQLVWPLTALL